MSKVNIKNKKASFEYHLLDKFTAGIVLTGTEVKALRDGKASIAEAYCLFINDELWVRNMHIAEYDPGSYNNHPPLRDRKLLLQQKELQKLSKKMTNKGLTIVATRLYFSESGYAKLDIALAQGKKLHDKRDSIKDKDIQRTLDRAMKK
ncbi:MAG: SsrA-binding protein SmpB [Cryomorphaceae bacterium]|nr:MAG: SsrA-binding protein SmpB [Cryomorphaceae bacterium]